MREHLAGATKLLVTHDMREAVRLAAWLVVMHRGRVMRAGPTSAVLHNPGNDYVCRLLTEQLP